MVVVGCVLEGFVGEGMDGVDVVGVFCVDLYVWFFCCDMGIVGCVVVCFGLFLCRDYNGCCVLLL